MESALMLECELLLCQSGEKKFITNVADKCSVNLASPIGNLSSPYFGQSISLAGGFFGGRGGGQSPSNRSLNLMARFSF